MKLLFIGDVMLGRLVNKVLKTQPPKFVWGNTLPVFEMADWRACNLECVISDRGEPWSITPKVFHFRTDAKNVDALEAARIDAVSLANNHILDFEYEAMRDTMEILMDSDIGFSGAGINWNEASRPHISSVNSTKIAFLAATDNEPQWEATLALPGIFYVPIEVTDRHATRLFEAVHNVNGLADIVVVSLHWGPNWGYEAPQEHRHFARALVDAGADIVYGHSPHIFRGIEIFKNKPIFYSCGDFVDDYAVDEIERNDESFIFLVEADGNRMKKIFLYPTVIRDFAAHLAGTGMAESIAQKMQGLCRLFNTKAEWNKDLGLLEIEI